MEGSDGHTKGTVGRCCTARCRRKYTAVDHSAFPYTVARQEKQIFQFVFEDKFDGQMDCRERAAISLCVFGDIPRYSAAVPRRKRLRSLRMAPRYPGTSLRAMSRGAYQLRLGGDELAGRIRHGLRVANAVGTALPLP